MSRTDAQNALYSIFKVWSHYLFNIKQLLNSVLVGYEELLRQRFVLSAEAEG